MSIDIGALQVSHIDIGAFQLTPIITPSSGQIFVSNIDSILTADLDGSNSSVIIRDGDNSLEIMGTAYIDVDTINNKLLFMLLGLPSLCRMSELDGTLLENVSLPQSLNGITPSLAIDNSSTIAITNNGKTITGPRVFIADYSNQRIGVGNIVKKKDLTTGNFFTSIVINRFIPLIHRPVVIKYDEENNVLFWTGEGGVLAKTDIDGSAKTIIFDNTINPKSLVIDSIRRKLYYSGSVFINSQTFQGLIQANYDGLNKNLIESIPSSDNGGIGLDISSNNFYWLSPSNNKLYYDVHLGNATLILSQLDDPRDVKVNLFEVANIQSISRQKSLYINGSVGGVHVIITPLPIPLPSPPAPPPDPGTPPTPITPPPDPEVIPPPTILSLFIAAPEFIEQSMDLFIGSPQIDNYLGLYIGGPAGKTGLINLFIKVQEGLFANKDLFINGKDSKTQNIDCFISGKDIQSQDLDLFISSINVFAEISDIFIQGFDNSTNNIDLFIYNMEILVNQLDLFVYGLELITNQINLFIKTSESITNDIDLSIGGYALKTQDLELSIFGENIFNSQLDLFINGPERINDNINLFIHGTISGLPPIEVSDDNFGITLDELFKNADYNPQIIGRFVGDPNYVTIEIWDNNGNIITLTNSNCYQIGDTGRWAWSTANLPPLTKIVSQFIYRMTGNNLEIFESQFILHTRRKNSYKMPENNNHIRKI